MDERGGGFAPRYVTMKRVSLLGTRYRHRCPRPRPGAGDTTVRNALRVADPLSAGILPRFTPTSSVSEEAKPRAGPWHNNVTR